MRTLWRWIAMMACVLALALSAAAQTSWAVPEANGVLHNVYILHVDRIVLGADIVHYRYDVVVGTGKFDVIRLHRIVRERSPYRPIQTVDGVLLLPGSPNYFEAIFIAPLISHAAAWDHSIRDIPCKKQCRRLGYGLWLGSGAGGDRRFQLHEGLGCCKGQPPHRNRPFARSYNSRFHRPGFRSTPYARV